MEFTSDPESFGPLMYPEAGPMGCGQVFLPRCPGYPKAIPHLGCLKHSPADAGFCMDKSSYISRQDGGCSLSIPGASHACDPLAAPSVAGVWPRPACSCPQTRNWSGGRRDLLPATEEFHLKTRKEPRDLGCRSPAQTRSCK